MTRLDLSRTKRRLKEKAYAEGMDELIPDEIRRGGDDVAESNEEEVPDEIDTTCEIVSRDHTGEPELIKAPLIGHPTREEQIKVKVFTARDQYRYQIQQAEFKQLVEDSNDLSVYDEIIADENGEPVGMLIEQEEGDDMHLPFDLVAEVINKHLKEPEYGRVTSDKILEWNNNLIQAYWLSITIFAAGIDLSEDSSGQDLTKKKS